MRYRLPDLLRLIAFLLTAYGTIATFAGNGGNEVVPAEHHLHASTP